MNSFNKEIKSDSIINNNYKLIKFNNGKKSFKDTLLGRDIGIHSKGFINVISLSTIIAIGSIIILIINFRI